MSSLSEKSRSVLSPSPIREMKKQVFGMAQFSLSSCGTDRNRCPEFLNHRRETIGNGVSQEGSGDCRKPFQEAETGDLPVRLKNKVRS